MSARRIDHVRVTVARWPFIIRRRWLRQRWSAVVATAGLLPLCVLGGVAAADSAPQHITNKQVTSFTWTTYRSNNLVCPNSPDITKIDQWLSGPTNGDPREQGNATVHVTGYEDDTDGAGFLLVNAEITTASGSHLAHEAGIVTLSNTSKLYLGDVFNGVLAGTVNPGSDGTGKSWPALFAVTNITATVSYNPPSPAPVVIATLTGTMGDAASPDGPYVGPQRTYDDNPGVFMPMGTC